MLVVVEVVLAWVAVLLVLVAALLQLLIKAVAVMVRQTLALRLNLERQTRAVEVVVLEHLGRLSHHKLLVLAALA